MTPSPWSSRITFALIARGPIAVGFVAIGGVAIGVIAVGGIAVGGVAVGAGAVGIFAVGALALGFKKVAALSLLGAFSAAVFVRPEPPNPKRTARVGSGAADR